ncbi:23S rRNA (adenine(1618)-N(6))-methyltransferase RlmF [Pelagibaculum spongiae]|uniref:Ribosomal RNA large subunit methyltransferase F n=1 Tax=Pelagibaculum spongiae TaxID=2080658 RepID=A0A2V1GPX0_9GAMM|nr:23S rRNA (adenine(1618)-N(6))-methyltransferase RlmF [Pelagibaculum spongiae]PVZ65386.1 23S rRNA (adenine(1618)-N(6))-methyltransferase RlmF [Pelagibaculum spongiae]
MRNRSKSSHVSKSSTSYASKPSAVKTSKSVDTAVKAKGQLHSRSLHQSDYDFQLLSKVCPQLKQKIVTTPQDKQSIRFSDPLSVKLLNQALLKAHYSIEYWDLPAGYLCPPIPGRVDSIHYIADLLADSLSLSQKQLSERKVTGLDIGCGANLIYPLLGQSVYGWHFVAADIEKKSLAAANLLIEKNQLQKKIECRWQDNPQNIFKGIIQPGEIFDFSICNPPFHCSAEDAAAGSLRKHTNLQKAKQKRAGKPRLKETVVNYPSGKQQLNFAGQHNELWCDGGESAFVRRMIEQSKSYANQCYWFTSLVAKKENLPAIKKALAKAEVKQQKIISMSQGQKISRMVCWSFIE